MRPKIDKEKRIILKPITIRAYEEDEEYFKALTHKENCNQKDTFAIAMRLMREKGYKA